MLTGSLSGECLESRIAITLASVRLTAELRCQFVLPSLESCNSDRALGNRAALISPPGTSNSLSQLASVQAQIVRQYLSKRYTTCTSELIRDVYLGGYTQWQSASGDKVAGTRHCRPAPLTFAEVSFNCIRA